MRQKNFPTPLTDFIGRQKEVEEVGQLLTATRLFTLLGPGGVGKTRLALKAVSVIEGEFQDGVCWVDLASLIDPSLIPQTIVKLLGIYISANQPPLETLEGYLQSKQLLLVMDNCEHLISACAALAEHLLYVCPKLHVLTVSREDLGVLGEVTWHVPSLPYPNPGALPPINQLLEIPSIRLFIERAAEVLPGYTLTALNEKPIAIICQKLDGLPLAIELAAARIKLLSAKEISDRLVNRFNILAGGNRNALPRHQTLRATLDWSYDLLTDLEQSLFLCLSVFAGNFSLEAAEQVTRAITPISEGTNFLDLLVQLVNKSLINVEIELPGSRTGTRYRMLETIREYAREKLVISGNSFKVHSRYLDYYLGLVKEGEPKLYNQEQEALSDRLEIEYDNLRAAIEWALENKEAEVGAQLIVPMERFWQVYGDLGEAVMWLNRILALPGIVDTTRAKLLLARGHIAEVLGEYDQAKAFVEEGQAIFKAQGDFSGVAQGNVVMGIISVFQGEREKGIRLLEESLRTFQEAGDDWSAARALLYLADSYSRTRNNQKAKLLCQEALALFHKLGDSWGIAFASGIAGEITRQQGDLQHAKEYFRSNLIFHWQHGQMGEISFPLETLALIAITEKKYKHAVHIWGAAEFLREKAMTPLPRAYQSDYRKYLVLARENLGEKAYDATRREGRELSLEAVIALATHDDLANLEAPSTNGSKPIVEFQLTQREIEILRLVATGMSDAKIADQLFLSPRTVGKHLEFIYNKLRVHSRTAATHFALTHRLIE